MGKLKILSILVLGAWLLSGCGAKPAMEGGQSDSTEQGTVNESGGSSSSDSATGKGDTTSFSDENVEKVDEYIVRRGDNLWNIAAKGSVYHSGWLYSMILKANRGKISNPKDLKIGTVLKIPRGLPQEQYDQAREEAMAGVFENEVGPLQEMQTDLPSAPPTPGSAKDGFGKAEGKKHSMGWLLWLLLIALAAVGAWQLIKMKKKPDEAEGAPGADAPQ